MREVLVHAIEAILTDRGFTVMPFTIEHPAELRLGDYATNVALVLAKVAGKPARVLAEELAQALSGKIGSVERIEVAGPGFINFFLSRRFFAQEIERVNSLGENWGKNDHLAKEEIIFEYTSPNLFKPLHVGNLVGNIIGESLTRLFESGGAKVHRVNYPSDIGLTVAKGVWGLRKTGGDPADINQIGEAYRVGNDAYENDGAAKLEIEAVNRALYAKEDSELVSLREQGLVTSKDRLCELCKILGTHFDAEIYESEVSDSGKQLVLENVGGVFTESEGAIVYQGEKQGLHTRVFVNSQGLPTYEAKDLGNFSRKNLLYPNWTEAFIVTGNEQREYFKVVISAIKEVFPDAKEKLIEHIATGFLTLTTGKMSSRKGNVLTGESLLEEMREEARKKAEGSRTTDLDELTEMVAVAALKYQILRQAPGTNIIFDKERALSFEGDSGPYLQYTHARLCSVLDKASQTGLFPGVTLVPETVYEVERLIYQFPEIVKDASSERAPHKVTAYLTVLAGAFNSLYARETIADRDDVYAPYKLAIAEAVKTTLRNGLWTLGIKAPDSM